MKVRNIAKSVPRKKVYIGFFSLIVFMLILGGYLGVYLDMNRDLSEDKSEASVLPKSDLNENGIVEPGDITIFISCYSKRGNIDCARADYNKNGETYHDFADFPFFREYYVDEYDDAPIATPTLTTTQIPSKTPTTGSTPTTIVTVTVTITPTNTPVPSPTPIPTNPPTATPVPTSPPATSTPVPTDPPPPGGCSVSPCQGFCMKAEFSGRTPTIRNACDFIVPHVNIKICGTDTFLYSMKNFLPGEAVTLDGHSCVEYYTHNIPADKCPGGEPSGCPEHEWIRADASGCV